VFAVLYVPMMLRDAVFGADAGFLAMMVFLPFFVKF
jgi:hypothetical protein